MRADLLVEERRARRWRRLLGAGVTVMVFGTAFAMREALMPAPGLVVAAAPLPALLTSAPPPPVAGASLKTRPLAAWLSDIARDAGRDLVISPELRGDLTASESSTLGWEQRLDAYSRVFGFDAAVSEGMIEVKRGPERAHDFKSGPSYPGGQVASSEHGEVATDDEAGTGNDGSHGAHATRYPPVGTPHTGDAPISPSGAAVAESPPPQTRVVHLAYSAAKDTASVLTQAGKALDVTVTADASSNSVVLSGQPVAIGRVLAVIGELDRPRRRILLDAKIIEVTRSARLDLGVEWKLTGTTVGGDVKFPPPASDAGSAALVIATHGAAALDARISALEASGKLHVVSRPSVVMLEGSPATVESARILRIRLPSNGNVVGSDVVQAPSSGRATEEIPVGVRLEVTPAIRGGGRVLLRIKAKSSSLGAPLPPDDIPEELSRMVDAEVLVTSGETAVLGGLTRESGTRSGSGVPLLRKVPGLGLLFGKKSDQKEEEELLVLVTPRVLD